MKKQQIHIPNCFICLDLGFVLYRKKVGEYEGEYVAHCTCQAGRDYAYDGTRCEKQKSPYYTASVEELDHVGIAAQNLRSWIERNKDKKGFKEAMNQLGMKANVS